MRPAVVLACLFLAFPASAADRHKLPTLTPAEAIAQAANASPMPLRAVFQFKVASAAKSGSGYDLDSDKNFRSPTNLSVAIRSSAMPALTKRFGADLKSALAGKTVKIIGEARRLSVGKTHNGTATQIEVTHAGQILSVD